MITSLTRIEFSNELDAKNAFRSLKPEGMGGERAEVLIRVRGRNMSVRVTARDIGAFRAVVNSYAKLIGVIEKVGRIIK